MLLFFKNPTQLTTRTYYIIQNPFASQLYITCIQDLQDISSDDLLEWADIIIYFVTFFARLWRSFWYERMHIVHRE